MDIEVDGLAEEEDSLTCEFCGDVCESSITLKSGEDFCLCEECMDAYIDMGWDYTSLPRHY